MITVYKRSRTFPYWENMSSCSFANAATSAHTAANGSRNPIPVSYTHLSGYLVVSRTLMNSNWRIAGIIDRGFLTQSSKDITHIVMLVLLLSLIHI